MIKSLEILAGGTGSRAKSLTNGGHKSLLKLPDGSAIVERIINQGNTCGIKKIYLVYNSSTGLDLINEVKKICSNLDIDLIILDEQPHKFQSTALALNLICKSVSQNEITYIIEGDVIISDTLSKNIFSKQSNIFFIDNKNKNDRESMKVKLKDSFIILFSKKIENYREFCGIMVLDKQIRKGYLEKTKNIGKTIHYYEDVFNRLKNFGYLLPYQIVPEYQWHEIDDETDYKIAIKKFRSWSKIQN